MIISTEEKNELLRMLENFGQFDKIKYIEFLGENQEYAVGMCAECGESSPVISACCGATVLYKRPEESLAK